MPLQSSLLTSRVPARNLRAPIFRPILLFSDKFLIDHETHISTEPHQAKKSARVSGQDVDERRAPRIETASRERPRTAVPLTRRRLPIHSGGRFPGAAPRPMAAFTRQRRLLTGTDFDRVFKRSRRSADQLFTVLYRANGLGYARLGLAIAKKRIRRAVDRNRLKRLIRESFRRNMPGLGGVDVVVMARDAATATANAAVVESLDRHWRTLNKPDIPEQD